MKKYILIGALTATSLFAVDSGKIIQYFKTQVPPHIKVEVVDTQKLKEFPGYEYVDIKLSDGDKSQSIQMFSKGDFLFPEIIDLKKQKSMRQLADKIVMGKKLKAIYAKEDKSNIITIGNDSKKDTLVIFTDPECPYCRNELLQIEDELENYNLKLLITPVHGENSLKKAHLIYKNIKNAKTDKDKIKILRKYYAEDINITGEKVTSSEVEAMENLRSRYVGSVVKGVPFTVQESQLK